jgi:FlaA1/EpsC-like NDP-sugar epimerase
MIVIFGGTGTLGRALSRVIVEENPHTPVWIVSRCELRQKEMKEEFPGFKYVIGDVTNTDWAEHLPPRVESVFNLAAMKHVDIAEHNVRRCVDINYHGTVNTYLWSQKCAATYAYSSTDKAVLPINAYGMSKALGERYLSDKKNAAVFRWGNVIGSRGSVFHSFAKTLKSHDTAYITHPEMTRFWIHIDDVARFMWNKRRIMTNNEAHIPEMKGASVLRMANAVATVLSIPNPEIVFTGIRPGEKIHECLRTGHDYCLTSNNCEQFTDDELLNLVSEVLNDSVTGQQGEHGPKVSGCSESPGGSIQGH